MSACTQDNKLNPRRRFAHAVSSSCTLQRCSGMGAAPRSITSRWPAQAFVAPGSALIRFHFSEDRASALHGRHCRCESHQQQCALRDRARGRGTSGKTRADWSNGAGRSSARSAKWAKRISRSASRLGPLGQRGRSMRGELKVAHCRGHLTTSARARRSEWC